MCPRARFYSYYGSENAFAAVLGRYWTSIVQTHGAILSAASLPRAQRGVRFFEALAQDHAEQGFAPGCLIGNLALELSDQNGEAREACELASMVIEAWEGAVARRPEPTPYDRFPKCLLSYRAAGHVVRTDVWMGSV
ncbi:hypothetical protein [Streptomyces canus]|uniref:LmrA/YxaF family transcription factor n=1 Tax=Streptomyces canus TaxID=58343 RepID=UPI00382120FB